MIKWLKNKIDIHNASLDYGNYEDHWGFAEWIFSTLMTTLFPVGLGGFLTYATKDCFFIVLGIIITPIVFYFKCDQIALFSKIEYPEENVDPYNLDNLEFIWGVKSWDDLTSSAEANMFTMNDIDLTYNKKEGVYLLSIETIYHFEEGKIGEVKYFNRLFKEFTKFMKDNNYDINEPYLLEGLEEPWLIFKSESITQLYTKFRIFVEGYNAVYGGKQNETICDI